MTQNYYSQNPLNRLSYLRSSPGFLASALSSPKAQFLLYDGLNPLAVLPEDRKRGTKHMHYVKWDQVKESIGQDPKDYFKGVDGKDAQILGVVAPSWLKGKDEKIENLSSEEKRKLFTSQPALVFLGVDERSAPESEKSLPVSKPTESSTLETHSPHGIPFWAYDVTNNSELKSAVLSQQSNLEFTDMRAGMQSISPEEAAIAGEGRALIDWNTRNLFCAACSRPLRSVWSGWKRACIPGEAPTGKDNESTPPCISKKGVHNFNYPRTDPVVIMAVLSPDKEQILLGRQKAWPKKFYSCLAGFIEPCESFEEAVAREIYEEAGIEVDSVHYHSSQPWPYPANLMIGAIAVAKEGQTIRCDLDNELEDARYFTRQQVLDVMNAGGHTLSRHEVAKIDGKKLEKGSGSDSDSEKKPEKLFNMPPKTAIAYTLVEAWANNTWQQAKL